MGAPRRPPQFSAVSEAQAVKNQSSHGMEAQLGRLKALLKGIEEGHSSVPDGGAKLRARIAELERGIEPKRAEESAAEVARASAREAAARAHDARREAQTSASGKPRAHLSLGGIFDLAGSGEEAAPPVTRLPSSAPRAEGELRRVGNLGLRGARSDDAVAASRRLPGAGELSLGLGDADDEEVADLARRAREFAEEQKEAARVHHLARGMGMLTLQAQAAYARARGAGEGGQGGDAPGGTPLVDLSGTVERDVVRLDEADAAVSGGGDPGGEEAGGEDARSEFTEDYDGWGPGPAAGGFPQAAGAVLGLDALEEYLRVVTGAMGGAGFGVAAGDSDDEDDTDDDDLRFRDGTRVADEYPEGDHDMRLEEVD